MPKKKTTKYGLTDKEYNFCQEYLIDFNATAAYIRAGYKATTNNSAAVEAHKLLRNPKITLALEQMKACRSRRVGVSQDRVIQELAKIAFACITDVVQVSRHDMELKREPDKDDYAKHSEWRDNMCAVSEVTQTVSEKQEEYTTTYKVKLHDKTKALTLLMKHLGMLNDFDMAIACLREKYGLSLTRDDDGLWQVIDLSRISA